MRTTFEKVLPAAGGSFALRDRRERRFEGVYHVHPELEITLIEASTGRRVVGDRIERFGPGDLVMLGANLPHQYHGDPAGSEGRAAAKVIQFQPAVFGEEFWQMPEMEAVRGLLERSGRGLAFSSGAVERAEPLIEAVFRVAGARRVAVLVGLLDLLAGDAGAQPIASAGYRPGLSSREGEAIDRALRFMDRQLDQPLSRGDLCRHLGITPATCNRLFRKSLRRSFKAMLIEMRISRACRLLLESEDSIVEVAQSSGFPNLSNFNRQFKALKGMPPRRFRAMAHRELVAS